MIRATESDGSQWVDAESFDHLLDALRNIAGGFIDSSFVTKSPSDWHSAFGQLQEIAKSAIQGVEEQ